MVGVVVRRLNDGDKFYTHNVEIVKTNGEAVPLEPGAPEGVDPGGRTSPVRSVLQNIVAVKNEITQEGISEVKDLSLPAEGAVQSSLTDEAEGVKDLSRPKVGDVQYSFASEEANTANNDLLDTAKDLETRGVSSEEIRRSTGWFRGMDGKWRFEIDDSGMSVKLPEYAFNHLRDLIRHEKYRVYAQLLYAMQLQRRSASAEAVCGRGSGQSRNGSFHQSLRAQGHKRNSACR